ncbi:MAG: SpoIIE family protein phosphatase [Bacteroides sp.]|nr:SpoIIE family protein phosphatase [Prevotella sp.]MCM1407787.1 SpoIIE family protein phosphatase [Treponema brennaborense]MCM1468865.1 SpoIIE family protein phosphatase [Bacteroides sp.]
MPDDIYVFIPLILTGILTAIIFFNLIRIKQHSEKSTASLFFGCALLLAGCAYIIFVNQSFFLFGMLICFILLICVSYTRITLADAIETEKIKESQKELPPETAEQTDSSPQEAVISGAELSLIDICRDFMIHAASSFSEEKELSKLLDYMNKSMISTIHADGGAILLVDDFEDILAVKTFSGTFPPPYKLPADLPHKVIRVETNFRFAQFPLSETIFGEVASTGKSELITDPVHDSRLFQNEPEEFLQLGTYIIIPMVLQETVIGVAAFARKKETPAFTEEDFEAAKILTGFACAAIKNVYSFQEIIEHSELTRESGLACKIQDKLHPKLLPAIPTLSLGHYFNTAEGVCGDYFDVLPSRKDRISFIIADVAGKGMNSLIVMVMIRAILKLIVNTTQSAATILGWANRGICAESSIDHFASVALINYDSTNGKVQLSTAGSIPVLLYDAEHKTLKKVSRSSEPIGVEKTTAYKDCELTVSSGDIIVTYTDGVVETVNAAGAQYTMERLSAIITKNSNLTGKEIANLVKTDIMKFNNASHLHDDQTLLVIKIQ